MRRGGFAILWTTLLLTLALGKRYNYGAEFQTFQGDLARGLRNFYHAEFRNSGGGGAGGGVVFDHRAQTARDSFYEPCRIPRILIPPRPSS